MPAVADLQLPAKFLPVPVACVTILAMPRYSDWPLWLQVLVVAPHGLLLSAALWLWWPMSEKDRKKFGIVLAYLLLFVAVMHFVFHF